MAIRTQLTAVAGTLLCALALFVAFAPSASAEIYWSTLGAGDNGTTIGRANSDGSGVNPSFITGADGPCGVAINSTHIFWMSSNNNDLGRANLDGSGVNNAFVTSPSGSYCDVAVNASHIFWGASGYIGRSNLDGSAPSNTFLSAPNTCGLAVGSKIYWVNTSIPAISRADIDGTNSVSSFVALTGWSCIGLTTDTHLYWSNGLGGIARANVDGSGLIDPFITANNNSCGMASDGVHLYWTNDSGIGRANLDGSGVNANFITALDRPCGVAATQAAGPPIGPPVGPGAPSVVVKSRKARKNGNINLVAEVSGAGKVTVAQQPAAKKSKKKKKKKSPKLIKKASKNTVAAGRVTLQLKPTKAAKSKLKRGKKVKVKVLVTFTDGNGAKATAKSTITFKPAKKKKR